MGFYVNASDVYAEGVPSTVPQARIDRRIAKWEMIVEKLTKNVFRSITPGELTFDGNNGRIMHFNIPLISVSSLKINDETVALDADEFRVHNGRQQPQDDRQNPKIVLTGSNSGSIYRRTRGMFAKGRNQKITATWGYLEPDNTTPQAIKDALTSLVVLDLDNYFDSVAGAGAAKIVSPVRIERTDQHELQYMETEPIRLSWGMIPKDIADVLAMYRAPMAMAAPDNRYFVELPTYEPLVLTY